MSAPAGDMGKCSLTILDIVSMLQGGAKWQESQPEQEDIYSHKKRKTR